MTERLTELRGMPEGLVLDGELIVIGDDGKPSFPLLSQRVLHGWELTGLSFQIFDVLRVDGMDMMRAAYAERRSLLDELELEGPSWRTPEAFDDGEALLEATSRHGLEGIVAKKRSEPYRPGERDWIKVKHRHYWRFGQELERARRARRLHA
jgi:bifunctional non-homologous end joining protein LigD